MMHISLMVAKCVDVDRFAQRHSKGNSNVSMRRNRIIQRIKSHQPNSTGNDSNRNALSLAKSKDARTQWRRLRRDARSRGHNGMEDKGFQKEKVPVLSIEFQQEQIHQVDVTDSRNDVEDEVRMVDVKKSTTSNAQSLMQQKGTSQSSHPIATFHSQKRMDETFTTNEVCACTPHNLSKTRSLISKWENTHH